MARRRTGMLATAVALAAVALAGCGFGGDDGPDRPAAATAVAGTRVAPSGAPYAFVAPAGFAPTTLHAEDMKAGSHIDRLSYYDRPRRTPSRRAS